MKAVRARQFGGPEVLRLEDVPEPQPGPGQVVVRVAAAGVNPVDTYLRAGAYPRKPELPWTPGYDAAGTVEAVGAGVRRFSPGDRVFTARTLSGAYAEKALCSESQVHALPAKTSFEEGAALGVPYGTAFRALFDRGQAKLGDYVLVHGASGGVGTAAVQVARAAGLLVFGTAGTKEGLRLVEKEGAHHAFDHHEEGYLEKAVALTQDRGFDVIVEMLANVNLAADLGALAYRGRVVIVGSRGAVAIDPRAAMTKDGSILGMSLMNASDEELARIYEAIRAGLEKGSLKPVIGKTFPLAEAAQAHAAVMAPGAHGKIILTV